MEPFTLPCGSHPVRRIPDLKIPIFAICSQGHFCHAKKGEYTIIIPAEP
jgi:hypothetical protein